MQFLFLLLVFTALISNMYCQTDTLLIHKKSGQVDKIVISQLQKITYENLTKVEEEYGEKNDISHIANIPNPFTENTSIEFTLSQSGYAQITIYDITGKFIQTLQCYDCKQGKNSLLWNCLDSNNNRVQAGMYYYEIQQGSIKYSRTMIHIK